MSAPSTSGLSVELLLRVIDVKYGCFTLLLCRQVGSFMSTIEGLKASMAGRRFVVRQVVVIFLVISLGLNSIYLDPLKVIEIRR